MQRIIPIIVLLVPLACTTDPSALSTHGGGLGGALSNVTKEAPLDESGIVPPGDLHGQGGAITPGDLLGKESITEDARSVDLRPSSGGEAGEIVAPCMEPLPEPSSDADETPDTKTTATKSP